MRRAVKITNRKKFEGPTFSAFRTTVCFTAARSTVLADNLESNQKIRTNSAKHYSIFARHD